MKASDMLESHAKHLRGLGEFCTQQSIPVIFRGVDHTGNLNIIIIPPEPLDKLDLTSIPLFKKEDDE